MKTFPFVGRWYSCLSRYFYTHLGLMSVTLVVFIVLNGLHGYAQKRMERLNRGVVAVRTSASQVYVGWRMFGTEPANVAFNVYRGSTKINSSPITNSTNIVDNTSTNATYTVRPVINGVEQPASESASVWAQNYLSIPIQVPPGGTTPTGEAYTYSANDCSVGDLDGDGDYEIVVKWDPSNSKDNSQAGYTGNVYLDAYRLDGTRLWRIDLGRNIRAGAHYTQFMVYDLDSDGKAEVACKTADGTRDGRGTVIGNASADYRNSSGYILTGPEFLTIFNGQTGAAMATADYVPARGTVSSWGDGYGNRVDRFVSTIAYVDGQRPSLIMGRGYYTRLVRVAWDWRNGQLTRRWTFDSNSSTPGNSNYAGQGNHQLTTGDLDGDGKDEIVNGSSVINDNGAGLYANGLGHGDALHMSDMDPDRPGQEVWQPHEDPGSYGNYGLEFRDARTGQPLWGVPATGDVGRGLAADIDPRYKGYECWGSTGGLYTCKGQQISTAKPSSANFAIWWDGDLSREILDGATLNKWDPNTSTTNRLFTIYNSGGATPINGSKNNPGVTADLLGDWREEMVYRNSNSTQLLLFTTTATTSTRIYTLMHDAQYRVAVAHQNSAYNQPPHPSFYLGTGMSTPPTPNITLVGTGSGRIGDTESAEKVSIAVVYPNPTTGSFVIKAAGQFSFQISDEQGRTLEQGQGQDEVTAGGQLKAGLYIVNVQAEQGKKAIKVVKQ
ncbi:T9SS type A sorting domain-containing protein [Spirosoma soli]|uniref:T9SS type A sorting domain-containing protein n=1 Tax=Spirosoma soli TaxID=1770529 RepID=A0ABW5LW75_9BACT